jgi:hypothetical protein
MAVIVEENDVTAQQLSQYYVNTISLFKPMELKTPFNFFSLTDPICKLNLISPSSSEQHGS